MNVLFLLDNGNTAPSAMVRALQYRELLARRTDVVADFAFHRWPALHSAITWLSRRSWGRPFIRAAGKLDKVLTRSREKALLKAAMGYDIVYLVKIPNLRLYQKLAALRGPKLYMDLNDGLWLPAYHGGGWEDLDSMLRLVDAVVCENRFVASYAKKYLDKVYVVHDPPQVEVFDRHRGKVAKDAGRVTIGWIGSPMTSDPLFSVWEPMEKLFEKHPNLHLRIVGANPVKLPRFEKVKHSLRQRYDQESMAEEVLAMDIGLFPLFATEDAQVRGTLKAMVYMSGSAVAVCRDIGEIRDLITHGENGILYQTAEEWFAAMDALVTDIGYRRRLAEAGLATIRARFTRAACLEELLASFRKGLARES